MSGGIITLGPGGTARFQQSQGHFPKGPGVLRQRLSRRPVQAPSASGMCQGPAPQESPSPMQGHPGTHSTQTRREGCRAHPQDGSIPAPARGADWAHIQTCPPVSFTLTSVTCLPRQQGTSPKPWDPRQHQATGQVAQYAGHVTEQGQAPPNCADCTGPRGSLRAAREPLQLPRDPRGSQHRQRIPKLSQRNTIYSGSSSGT